MLPYAVDYGRIIVLGFPFSSICCAFGDIIRADCRPKESMAGLLIGCITNLILDPVFIFVFHWGVEGAAWATIIGQFLNAVYFVWRSFHFKTLKLEKKYFRLQWDIARRVCTLGGSNFITQISSVVVMTVLNNLLTIYGAASEYGADIPLAAVCAVVSILFQAIGKAGIAAFLSLTRQILYFVPTMVILSRIIGLDGILWGAAVSDTLAFVTAVILLAVCWKKIFKAAPKSF